MKDAKAKCPAPYMNTWKYVALLGEAQSGSRDTPTAVPSLPRACCEMLVLWDAPKKSSNRSTRAKPTHTYGTRLTADVALREVCLPRGRCDVQRYRPVALRCLAESPPHCSHILLIESQLGFVGRRSSGEAHDSRNPRRGGSSS